MTEERRKLPLLQPPTVRQTLVIPKELRLSQEELPGLGFSQHPRLRVPGPRGFEVSYVQPEAVIWSCEGYLSDGEWAVVSSTAEACARVLAGVAAEHPRPSVRVRAQVTEFIMGTLCMAASRVDRRCTEGWRPEAVGEPQVWDWFSDPPDGDGEPDGGDELSSDDFCRELRKSLHLSLKALGVDGLCSRTGWRHQDLTKSSLVGLVFTP